jgi:hypothetical protein
MGNWFTPSSSVRDTVRICELEKEIELLRKLNDELVRQIKTSREHTLRVAGGNTSVKVLPSVSKEKLMAWVDDQLQKQESNSKWIPDFAERKLKVDIFNMILGMVDHILETTKVEIMGHVIRFDLAQD